VSCQEESVSLREECGWHTAKRYVRSGEREYVEEKGPMLFIKGSFQNSRGKG
jgi:hypothetical protein